MNLDDIWTLAEEKEASGKLARDDGIGDEWSSTFYKLVLKLVGNVPDTPQVLLQVLQNLQAIVGHVVQDDHHHVLDVDALFPVPPEDGALQGLSNGGQAKELPPYTAARNVLCTRYSMVPPADRILQGLSYGGQADDLLAVEGGNKFYVLGASYDEPVSTEQPHHS